MTIDHSRDSSECIALAGSELTTGPGPQKWVKGCSRECIALAGRRSDESIIPATRANAIPLAAGPYDESVIEPRQDNGGEFLITGPTFIAEAGPEPAVAFPSFSGLWVRAPGVPAGRCIRR